LHQCIAKVYEQEARAQDGKYFQAKELIYEIMNNDVNLVFTRSIGIWFFFCPWMELVVLVVYGLMILFPYMSHGLSLILQPAGKM
jgi:hypothetical protein